MPAEDFGHTVLRQLGDVVEDVGEPSPAGDVVELRGAHEGVHHHRPLAAAIGAGEEQGPPTERDATQRLLGGVVPGADALAEESGEAVPTLQHIIHCLGHGSVAREPGALGAHPAIELCDKPSAPLPPHDEATGGGLAADRALDIEQCVDLRHSFHR